MILRSSRIYQYLSLRLNWVKRPISHKEARLDSTKFDHLDVIVCGLGRYGRTLTQDLQRFSIHVLGVDFDPKLVNFWRSQGITIFYGDAEDPEFLAVLPMKQAQWIISTLPGQDSCLKLLNNLQHHHYQGQIGLISHTVQDILIL
ncbi:MAG: NAD(P)-binding protein [Limnothrix sp.]